MKHRMTRRALLKLAPGLLVVPALAPSLARSAWAGPLAAATPSGSTSLSGLDELLAANVAQGFPGIALAVERAGESVFAGAAGVASIEQQTPLKATDRFRIYSIAKSFAAIVVLQSVDEGTLSLDDTVAKWLDDPAVAKIPNVDRATVRHLLNHTSGIYDFADDTDSTFWQDAFLGPNAGWTKVWTLDELLAYADGANHAPYFAPGEGHHYSNTEYLLVGMIVEKATGKTYGDELRTRILEPLALNDTFLAEGAAMPDGVVDGYQMVEGERFNVTISNLSWVWAAGAMISTTADLLRYGRALFGGELISPESFKEMFTFVPTANPRKGEGMGVYRIETANGALVGMDGQGAGFTASLMRQPTADITVATLANLAPVGDAVDAIRDEAIAWTLAIGAGAS